jgi:hypothetical protein
MGEVMAPRLLYKYMPPSRAFAIEGRLLRFTPPSEFPDYYESFPRVAGPNRRSVRRKLSQKQDLDDAVASATPHFRTRGPQAVFDMVSQTFGVLCLTSRCDHPLLWAQYTAGHRGFAVGFLCSHEWLHAWQRPMPPIDAVQQVAYADKRPEITSGYSADLRRGEREEQARAMLCTKFTPWRYEEEWRLIRPLDAADLVCHTDDGTRIHLFRFPADAVAEIVVGARISDSDLQRLTIALSAADLSRVPVLQAQRNPVSPSFLLEVRDLDRARLTGKRGTT